MSPEFRSTTFSLANIKYKEYMSFDFGQIPYFSNPCPQQSRCMCGMFIMMTCQCARWTSALCGRLTGWHPFSQCKYSDSFLSSSGSSVAGFAFAVSCTYRCRFLIKSMRTVICIAVHTKRLKLTFLLNSSLS